MNHLQGDQKGLCVEFWRRLKSVAHFEEWQSLLIFEAQIKGAACLPSHSLSRKIIGCLQVTEWRQPQECIPQRFIGFASNMGANSMFLSRVSLNIPQFANTRKTLQCNLA